MKKSFYIIFIFVFLVISAFLQNENSSYYKINSIKTPLEIYIDFNKNFIPDEKEPFIIPNILSVTSYNTQENKFLPEDKKFLFEYLEKEAADTALKNKFVKINNNDLTVNGKSYIDILISSGLFFKDTEKYKYKEISDKYNTDDYVIYNTKSRVYHNLSCTSGRNSKKYKVILKTKLP